MNYKLAVIPGDGIGPDVVEQTLLVLDKVGEKFGHTFQYHKVLAGGCAIDATGGCLPQETIDMCKASDAVLLGAVGGWKWDTLPGDQRPERALLGLRKALGLFANLRPALLFEQLADASPLKPEILAGGLDIVVVRELTGGIYFGEKGVKDTDLGPAAYDIEQYAEEEVRRIAKVAFDMAMKRSKHVTSVDKANVLESSRLWRRVVTEVAKDYPEVTLTISMWTTPPCSWSAIPASLTSSSPATSSGTSSLMKPARSPAPSACSPRPPWPRAISACMSPSTGLPPTSPARTRPIPWPPFSLPP